MKENLSCIWKMIRPLNLFIILLLFYVFRLFIIRLFLDDQTLLSDLAFFTVAFSTACIAAGGYIINDYFDRHIDAMNKPEKLLVGKRITPLTTIQAHFFFSFAGVLLGGIVAVIYQIYSLLLVQVLCVLALFYYSLRLKSQGIWGNLTIAVLVAVVPLIAGYYEFATPYQEIPMSIILAFAVFSFLYTLIRELVKDLEDMEGDEKYGRKTAPIRWGVFPTKIIIWSLLLISVGAMAYVQYFAYHIEGYLTTIYFVVFLQIPSIALIFLTNRAQTPKQYHFCSNVIKGILLFGILYGIIFYYNF